MNDQMSDKDLEGLIDDAGCVESNDQWDDNDIAALAALDN